MGINRVINATIAMQFHTSCTREAYLTVRGAMGRAYRAAPSAPPERRYTRCRCPKKRSLLSVNEHFKGKRNDKIHFLFTLLFYYEAIPHATQRLYLHARVILKVATQARYKYIQRTQVVVAIITPYILK